MRQTEAGRIREMNQDSLYEQAAQTYGASLDPARAGL